MGLISLKEKIKRKLAQKNYSEADVLYLLVEIGKYLERSEKNLGDPTDMELNEDDYPTVMFFRNWVAHTEKERGVIPESVLINLKRVSGEDNQKVEEELFKLLVDEIIKFRNAIGVIEDNKGEINWDSFFDCLKHILAGQRVKISHEEKYVGYDSDLLILKEL